jgi:regulator of protease activity HflC (stomatin/prohibitin superfamily)
MFILFIGVIVLIFGFSLKKNSSNVSRFKSMFVLGGAFIIAVGFITSTVRIVNPGEVGVQVLFGKVQTSILYEGLNFVNPFVDIETFNTRTQNYTMSASTDEGQKTGDDGIRILSNDGLDVNIDMTILYKVNPLKAPEILRNIGKNFESVIIRPVTRTGIRESAAQFKAIEIFSEKRQAFELSIRAAIQDTLTQRGFILDQILVRKIDLPPSVKESIERKITAIQDAQRMEFVLQKETSEAERKRVEARGVADAQNIVSSSLTDKLLQFENIKMMRDLSNSQNAKVIIMGDAKGTPPLFFQSK